jgi:hypothetical protein
MTSLDLLLEKTLGCDIIKRFMWERSTIPSRKRDVITNQKEITVVFVHEQSGDIKNLVFNDALWNDLTAYVPPTIHHKLVFNLSEYKEGMQHKETMNCPEQVMSAVGATGVGPRMYNYLWFSGILALTKAAGLGHNSSHLAALYFQEHRWQGVKQASHLCPVVYTTAYELRTRSWAPMVTNMESVSLNGERKHCHLMMLYMRSIGKPEDWVCSCVSGKVTGVMCDLPKNVVVNRMFGAYGHLD